MEIEEEDWLVKLWKRDKKKTDCSKFLMFGDDSQFVYSFRGEKKDSLAFEAHESGEYEPFKQVVRYDEM